MTEAHGAVMWPSQGPGSGDRSEVSGDTDVSLPHTFPSCFYILLKADFFFFFKRSKALFPRSLQLLNSSPAPYFTSGCNICFQTSATVETMKRNGEFTDVQRAFGGCFR